MPETPPPLPTPGTSYRYDVRLSFPAGLPAELPAGTRVEIDTEELDSRYFDTDRFDLLRHGVGLRCWTSAHESGWRLFTLPETDVDLFRVPFNHSGTTPDAVLDVSLGLRLGHDLREVARVQVDRTISEVAADDGETQLRLIDDTFRATTHGSDGIVSATQWRELTATATSTEGEQLLTTLDKSFRRQAAVRGEGTSALLRAMSGSAAVAGLPPAADLQANPLLAYVLAQRRVLIAADVALRLGQGDIHQTRVATRRLRSTLSNFAHTLHATRARDLDVELAWYAHLLGDVRDNEVLAERLLRAVADLPPETVLGPVAATIAERLQVQTRQTQQVLLEALSSPRYLQLLSQIDVLVDELVVATPHKPREIVLAVAKAEGRAKRRLAEAAASSRSDVALHSARKAIKRARYAAELAAPVLGAKRTAKKVDTYKELQEVLGQHQDGVVAAALLRELGAAAAADPSQNGFTYGVLHERELATARQARDQAVRWISKL